jgi:regulator of sirC expression with transglutaminase-like and TPR domain
MRKNLAEALVAAVNAPGIDLAAAALVIARLEYPRLDSSPYLARLDAMGAAAGLEIERHVEHTGDSSLLCRIRRFNQYLFADERFVGNRDRYEDPRNSCLNEVLDRRTGIPITLSVVYMEIGRRAGLRLEGVNFPGHFLVRAPENKAAGRESRLIIDPFHGGALLSEQDCRRLLQKHVGTEVAFSRSLLAPATRAQIVVRMLLNLKRLYVQMRSFPQARDATELLLAVTPSALGELRDRGLLAFHLNDMTSALRDLQTYLKLTGVGDVDKETRQERQQIWEHVKTLRRRMAGLN